MISIDKLKFFVALAFGVSLAGCASNKDSDDFVSGGIDLPHNVYGKLENSPSGYRFTSFTIDNTIHGEEPWVNLRTGDPKWSTSMKRCGEGFIKDRNEYVLSCSEVENEQLFMEGDFDEGDALKRVAGAVFTLGLTLTGVSYDVVFNQKKYLTALEQAKENLDVETLNKIALMSEEYNQQFELLKNNYSSVINQASVNVKVTDKTSLYNKNIDFRSKVHLKPNELVMNDKIFARNEKQLLKELEDTYNFSRKDWKHLTSYVNVNCNDGEIKGFKFTLTCPETHQVNNSKVDLNVKATVLTKSSDVVLPNNFEVKSRELILRSEGGKVYFENLSNRFVTVEELSFYYNDEISTKTNVQISLPPLSNNHESSNVYLKSFISKPQSISFRDIDRKKAESTNVKYGFAVKYHIDDNNNEKTMFLQNKYNLGSLIKNMEM